FPMLVLLDLDLPGMSGFDVLARLRRHPQFLKLPVVVFTGSTLSPDVSRAYRLGANSFITKPAGLEQLKTLLKRMLRPGGQVVMIDFKKAETPVGPPMEMCIDRADPVKEMEWNDFNLESEHAFLPYQYFLVFTAK